MAAGRRVGEVAVIFSNRRTDADEEGYAAAAAAMDAAAAAMPGYRGMVSTRGPDGLGITVSYWADEAAAVAWRDDPHHAAMRAAGRGRWYADYEVIVATVTRDYAWRRADRSATRYPPLPHAPWGGDT